ncbi:MAG: hypothetical protein BGO01_04505 [Armatimonadetes bacterium 55-13]|nr:helix-turn-helix transcriptional regulator [Armatimonadota bacterium]OJU63406.1 MAG: hypothetical protein BGO01_04505 [Armatimonadetes bacterium 55-13]
MSENETTECGSKHLMKGVLLLQEKWVMLIVSQLLKGPCGFNELARKAEGVSATTLSQRLLLLEESGVVTKTIHSTMPPRTSYELTAVGQAIEPILKAIEHWSKEYLPEEKVCPLIDELKKEG